VFLHGERVESFHLDGPAGLERRWEEIPQIFGDCTDVIVVEDIRKESVSARLELEWAKQRCLSLCLLLLDAESHPESRLLAVPEIEEFLTTPEVASFIRARLFVAPMPENTDLIGAINRAHGHGAARLVAILEEAGAHQDEIARCRASWDAVPAQTFRDEPSKEAVAFALVQAGAFHQLVTTPAERRGTFLVKLLSQPQFQQWRVGLTSWINPISAKNRATNRAVEEEEETRSTRRRPRPSKIQLPAEARLDVVSLQKNAVRKALTTGDLNQARAFCEDLVAHQERSSRPEHIAKSLCDLAQAAKDLGFHELQLEWMKKATDFAPGDGWSLAQLGDAYRCLGQWAQAERAFALALQHGAVSIARNGRAEALKGMGRLEDAFREYDAAVKEFPEDVFARNGRAEVLKGMGRLEDAFREYDATVKEFPQDVVARNGRAEVLKGMGRLEEALREYETIANEFPQDVFARNGRAEVLKGIGHLEDALREYETIANEFPQDVVARNGRAEVLKGMGRLQEALREYDATVKEFPQDVVARTGRAEVLKGMGRLEDALREYDATAKEFPQDVVARNGRAEVLKRMGRLEDAFREYETIAKEFPQDVVARNGRAEVLKGMGRLEDAFREYETIAKEFPQDAFARNGAASVCVLKGEYDSAAKWIGPLVDSGPPNWVGLHIVGMIRLRTGDTAKAVELFERGLRDGPFEDRPFFRSGLAYARLLSREIHQAAEILEGEASVVSKVLQIHIYGDLDQTERARQAYDIVRSNRNPQVIELTAELAARARLESRPRTRSDQWIQEREFELLMAA
jgi:tetratricopeptide (TPR) repeat protein